VNFLAIPAVTEAQVDAFLAAAAPMIGASPYQADMGAKKPQQRTLKAQNEPLPDAATLTTAMQLIPNDGPANWEHWNAIGMALWAATGGSDAGCALWHEWSAGTRVTPPPRRKLAGSTTHRALRHKPVQAS
jgi:hypothetical protein